MPEPVVDLPLCDIDTTALPRDRSAPDPVALAELRASVLKNGIRLPLEVFENLNPHAPAPYGLISGLRRLTVARELHAGGLAAFATVPARICAPASLPAALMRMVEENDIRAEIAPWTRRVSRLTVSMPAISTPSTRQSKGFTPRPTASAGPACAPSARWPRNSAARCATRTACPSASSCASPPPAGAASPT